MRLVRNVAPDGSGKYMLVLTRKLANYDADTEGGRRVREALKLLIDEGVVDDPEPKTEGEFFVLRLRDVNAQPALRAYAGHAKQFDEEFASEVMDLAARSGVDSPWCKEPD